MFARRLLVVLALTAALPAPAAEAVPLAEEAVVGANRPVVWLFPNETHNPMAAGPFIAQSALEYSGTDSCRGDNLPGRGQVDPRTLAEGGYHHYGQFPRCDRKPTASTKDPKAPFSLDLDDAARGGDLARAPTYYEFVKGQAITFWFLYGYNATDGFGVEDHEGDWERVSFILNAENRVTSVVFHEHAYACRIDPGELERDGGQPVVYSAQGTHASYPHPGSYEIKGAPPMARDHAGQGTRWAPPPIPVGNQTWYGYAGHWGNGTEAPDGPSPHRAGAPDDPSRVPTCECLHHFKSGCPFTT